MDSEKKSRLEKEKERLEALQNTEKNFLKGMYGDFFGKNGEKVDGSVPETELSFGETDRSGAEGGTGSPGGADGSGRGGRGGSSLSGRMEELEQKGREITDRLAARTDALIGRQREVTSQLRDRKDALQRANDALREVQDLMNNPLYKGMPDLTGSGRKNSAGPVDGTGMPDLTGSGMGNGTGLADGTGMPDTAASAPAQEAAQAAAQAQQAAAAPAEPETDPMEDLDGLIGLKTIKHDVKELTDFVKIQKMRKDGGLKSVPVSLHLVFTGNPGTGKTTVARILARLYKQIGVLSKGQLVEVDRSGLVAGYVGQTALKTAKKIEEARGGVLFIDEAYALARKDDTFGQEAIDTILKAMEDNREDFVVIVAGYTRPMENFINSNPGLKSRFNKYIEFPDYTIDELMGIFDMNCKKYDYEADEDVKAQVRAMIVQRKLATLENFANAREVRNFFEEIITNQARRVAAIEAPTQEDMKTILLEDLVETAEEDAEKTLKMAAEKAAEKPAETEKAADQSAAPGKEIEKAAETDRPAAPGKEIEKAAETDQPAAPGKEIEKAAETDQPAEPAEESEKAAEPGTSES